jgi:hypothetical protein
MHRFQELSDVQSILQRLVQREPPLAAATVTASSSGPVSYGFRPNSRRISEKDARNATEIHLRGCLRSFCERRLSLRYEDDQID